MAKRRIDNPIYHQAVSLRIEKRLSCPEIAKICGISLISARKWLRDYPLTHEERKYLMVKADKWKNREKLSSDERIKRQRASNREWYRHRRSHVITKSNLRKRRIASWFVEIKKTNKCMICGEAHPATLDFHHRDASSKILEVCTMANRNWSREKILREIEKCDVICSNCHRKLHWEEKQARIAQTNRA